MGHQLGVAVGTVLSAVLGFFVADQVRCWGWLAAFQSACGQSACVHATVTEVNAGLCGGRSGAAVWNVFHCQWPVCMLAQRCDCLQSWAVLWLIMCGCLGYQTTFLSARASLHACTQL
jgi:hypothetical protein